jgi:YD repeat-containing protein
LRHFSFCVTSVQEPGGKSVTYGCDPARRRAAMGAYGTGTFAYGYDAANRQTQVTTPALATTTFNLDAAGRLTVQQYANGASTSQSYDVAGNVTAIVNDGPSSAVSQFTYSYDLAPT